MRRLGLIALSSTLMPVVLAAQTPAASEPRGVMMAFETFADIFGSRLTAAFDSIPANEYGYKPTPVQQSIGYIAQHLEGANYGLCAQFTDLKYKLSAKDSLADTIKAKWPKDTLVARLKASLRFCDTALSRLTKLESPALASSLLAFETDLAEHYSQISSYMRLLGMVPPSALPPRKRTAITLAMSAMAPYAGLYELSDRQFEVTLRDGSLFITPTGGAARHLLPETPTDFFINEVDAQVSFARRPSGEVTGLVIHQFGRDRFAKKIR